MDWRTKMIDYTPVKLTTDTIDEFFELFDDGLITIDGTGADMEEINRVMKEAIAQDKQLSAS